MDEFHMWLIGTGVAVAIFTFGIWINAQVRLGRKIDAFQEANDRAHGAIHMRLDNKFNLLRDKIEELWKRDHK